LFKFRVDGGEKDHAAKVFATEGNVDQVTRTLKIKSIVKESHRELLPVYLRKWICKWGMSATR